MPGTRICSADSCVDTGIDGRIPNRHARHSNFLRATTNCFHSASNPMDEMRAGAEDSRQNFAEPPSPRCLMPIVAIVAKSRCNPPSPFVFKNLGIENGTLFHSAPPSEPGPTPLAVTISIRLCPGWEADAAMVPL